MLNTVPRRRPVVIALLLTLVAGLLPAVTQAPARAADGGVIRITEWMYDGEAEFVELTNVGDAPVDLTGWSYDDDSAIPGTFDLSGFGTVAAGESVIFTEAVADAFRTSWGLCPGVKVVGESAPGLGRNDQINIFDATGVVVDVLTYGDQDVPGSIRTQGASAWVSAAGLGADDALEWTLSQVDDTEGSWLSGGGDTGSPGASTRAAVAFDPCGAGPQPGAPTIGAADTHLTGAVGDPVPATTVLTVADDATPVGELEISVTSSDPAVIDPADVVITGDGAERTATLTPAGAAGIALVTFTVSDGDALSATVSLQYGASVGMPDTTTGAYHVGASDLSSAIDVGDDHMLSVDDELNTLFLHRQDRSGPPVRTFEFGAAELGTSEEIDFESIARHGDTVIAVGSHGNSRTGGVRPDRRVIVAFTASGSGADLDLAYAGRHEGLWTELRDWDATDGHGLGPDALGFVAATADGVLPNAPDGFNIEGFEFGPDDTTGYLGFRAPTVGGDALIVPVLDVITLVTDGGSATFGDPIRIDLDGRSIRDLRRNDHGEYLIAAGPTPSNDTWALYTWDGEAGSAPLFNRTLPANDATWTATWETIVAVPHPLTDGALVRIVADDGHGSFYGTGENKDLALGLRKSYSQLFALAAVPGDGDGDGDGDDDDAEPPSFADVPEGHLFDDEIAWLAAERITRGCNPPDNDRFCPDRHVSRGEMAAFLVRALELPAGSEGRFVDAVSSVFVNDIAALAAAGITRGCNPPTNDRFCPDRSVSRGEMAAFLVRALSLPVATDGGFTDTADSVFTADIDALAASGITRGCNPPANDRFCPDRPVSRGEMAAFLHRALR